MGSTSLERLVFAWGLVCALSGCGSSNDMGGVATESASASTNGTASATETNATESASTPSTSEPGEDDDPSDSLDDGPMTGDCGAGYCSQDSDCADWCESDRDAGSCDGEVVPRCQENHHACTSCECDCIPGATSSGSSSDTSGSTGTDGSTGSSSSDTSSGTGG